MKTTLALKAQSFVLITALLGYHAAVHSKLIIDKGEGRSEVSITIMNPSAIACGVLFTISDGRASIGGQELQQPEEKVQFRHAFTADGKYTIALLGMPVQVGERRFQACAVRQQAVVSVAGGQVSIEEPAVPKAAAQTVVQPIKVEPAAEAQKASQRMPGESADLLLFRSVRSIGMRFVTGMDGTAKLANINDLVNRGYSLCYLWLEDDYRGLGKGQAQAVLDEEVGSFINTLAGNRRVRVNNKLKCKLEPIGGKWTLPMFNPEGAIDVIAVQRSVIENFKKWEKSSFFEQFGEVKYDALVRAVDRREQLASQNALAEAALTAEITALAASRSSDKIGSYTLSPFPKSATSINVCMLEYAGPQGQAMMAYRNNLLLYLSSTVVNINQIPIYRFKTLDEAYIAFQKEPAKCQVFIDFPYNLKALGDVLLRDKRGLFEVNKLVSTQELLEVWAKKEGYENLAASEFAAQIGGTPSTLKILSDRGIKDKVSYDKILAEMSASKYSNDGSALNVYTYLEDKVTASRQIGSTATSIRLEREEKAEQLAKAEKVRLAELERIRSLPLNRATLEAGMDYIYFADGSCKESKSEQCMSLSQYRQMCGFTDGLTKGVRKVLGVFYNGPYSNFVETGGTMGNTKVLWQDGEKRCTVSFTISGTFQGSSHSKDFLGAAQTFVVTPSKQVLIHGGNIHAIN
jgi:hypothetical protein